MPVESARSWVAEGLACPWAESEFCKYGHCGALMGSGSRTMGNAQRAKLGAAEQVPRTSKTLSAHLVLSSLAVRAKRAMFCVTQVSSSVQMNQVTSLVIWTRACPRGNNPRTHRPHEEKSNTAGTRGSAPPRDGPTCWGPGGEHRSIRADPACSTCQAHRQVWTRTQLGPPICMHSLSTVLPHPHPAGTDFQSGRPRRPTWFSSHVPGALNTSR